MPNSRDLGDAERCIGRTVFRISGRVGTAASSVTIASAAGKNHRYWVTAEKAS
jgi:hypothetical protein